METYFSTNASFQAVEMDFLASANHFLYIFSRFLPVKSFYNIRLLEMIMETDFRIFFLLLETIIEIRRNPVF